jgi:hypothetical protein
MSAGNRPSYSTGYYQPLEKRMSAAPPKLPGFDAETQAIIDQAQDGNYGEMIENPYLLDPEAIAAFVEMGIDPTGKTAAELEAEVDTLIIKEGALTLFDPKDPLDYLAGGLMLSGAGLKAGAALKTVRTTKKVFDSSKKISKYQKLKNLLNPFYKKPIERGPTVTPLQGGAPYTQIKIPKIPGVDPGKALMYGGAGVQYIDETLASNQLAEDAANIQKDIDKLKVGEVIEANKAIAEVKKNLEEQKENKAEADTDTPAEADTGTTAGAETVKDKRPSISDIFGTPQFDRFIRNVGSALVKTGQVGAGLAQGAAAAAEERAAEELALKLKLIEAAGKTQGITPNKLSELRLEYQKSAGNYEKGVNTQNLLFQVLDIVDQAKVTGLAGLADQIKFRFGAAINLSGEETPVIAAANILEEVARSSPGDFLGQTGRLSDQDILMAQELLAALKGPKGLFKTDEEIEKILRRRLVDIGTEQRTRLNSLRELDFQIRRAGDIPPTIITDFSSGSGVTPESTNQDEINIKLQPEEDVTVTTDENKKYSFGSGGVYVPQSG